MKLRSASSSKTLCAALVSAFILFLQSAGWAQSLTASANPPSGGAGVTNSYLTGSGFPAGAITGATVHFGASCAVPAVASGPVIQVTTRECFAAFGFLIPASLTPGSLQSLGVRHSGNNGVQYTQHSKLLDDHRNRQRVGDGFAGRGHIRRRCDTRGCQRKHRQRYHGFGRDLYISTPRD